MTTRELTQAFFRIANDKKILGQISTSKNMGM